MELYIAILCTGELGQGLQYPCTLNTVNNKLAIANSSLTVALSIIQQFSELLYNVT